MDRFDRKKGVESGAGENEHGNVKISDEVIASCVRTAAKRVSGMYDFSGGLRVPKLGKDPMKGIKISQNDGLVIDVHIIVNYGAKIPEVAWDVQENVKSEVENMLSMEVTAVNIHVQGVHFPNEK